MPPRAALILIVALLALPATARGAERDPDRLRVELVIVEEKTLLELLATLFQHVRLRTIGIITPSPGTKLRVVATAYSSTPDQTDLTPCITAIGTRVRRGVVATNFLPIGTRLRITHAFGAGLTVEDFVVEDRMNSRYNGKYIVDIWFPKRKLALEFGKRTLTIEILGYIPRSELKKNTRQRVEAALARQRAESPADVFATTGPSTGPLRRAFAGVNALFERFVTARLPLTEDADCLTDDVAAL